MTFDWNKFYKNNSEREAHPILEAALEFFPKPGLAYDMGAGAGVDTAYLLEKGWRVHAIDKEKSSLDFISNTLGNPDSLILEESSFENLVLQKCQLIFGASSFPFCRPDHFDEFWAGMLKAIADDGILCGTLIGTKDEWAGRKEMTVHDEKGLLKLFEGLDILFFDETEDEKVTPMGTLRHRHIYSFILRINGRSFPPSASSQ